jgi:hypothetical protein
MKVFMGYRDCASCGGRHHFNLPPTDPVAPFYVYICPATGRPGGFRPWGAWKVFRALPPSAVLLFPVEPAWGVSLSVSLRPDEVGLS